MRRFDSSRGHRYKFLHSATFTELVESRSSSWGNAGGNVALVVLDRCELVADDAELEPVAGAQTVSASDLSDALGVLRELVAQLRAQRR